MTMPVRPAVFDPFHAPPGVEVRLDAYKTSSGALWWPTRPAISPRLQLVHTNGAEGEGTIESAINWGNRAPTSNTHPHYQVDRHRAAKLVPTDRKAIGNATVDAYQAGHGDVAEWSIVIETADLGWPTPNRPGAPGGAAGFIGDQVEMIAGILAYESIVHGIPLRAPEHWYGPGTAAHTDPFGYPYWTIVPGKPCPGAAKKRELVSLVLPRARVIAAAWAAPTPAPDPEVPDMRLFNVEDQNGGVVIPSPLFGSGDGITAVHVQAEQWPHLPASPIDRLTRAQAVRYTFVGGSPPLGFRGIWANA